LYWGARFQKIGTYFVKELNKRFIRAACLYVKNVLIKRNAKKKKTRSRNKARDGKRNIVGSRIRALRRKIRPKMTQDDLAGRVAAMSIILDRTAIYRIELGMRSVSDLELAALAKALRVDVADFFSKSKE
jgi:DNA-binding XRE family transcriptional regulator